jgi:hypothetical protein
MATSMGCGPGRLRAALDRIYSAVRLACEQYGRCMSGIGWEDPDVPVVSLEGWWREAKRGQRELDLMLRSFR